MLNKFCEANVSALSDVPEPKFNFAEKDDANNENNNKAN